MRQRRGQCCGLPGRGSLGQIQPNWEGIVLLGSGFLLGGRLGVDFGMK